MVSGVPCIVSGNWGRECDSLLYLHFVKNVTCKMLCLVLKSRVVCLSHIQTFSEQDGPQILLLESLANKQISHLFLRDNK